jgi:3-hydroxyisobutyrate dehydrogenase-like beta-hydroxyacid dehydrogenase
MTEQLGTIGFIGLGVMGRPMAANLLPDDAAVRAVVRDELLPAVRPGALIVDMSTVSPELSRELAADAASRGVRMLDAPVSGGDVGAREGTLSIMVGGDAADLERARPALEVLGGSIAHCGPAGTGQANVPLPLTAGLQQLFRQLRAAGRGSEDHTAVLAALEAQAGLGPSARYPQR